MLASSSTTTIGNVDEEQANKHKDMISCDCTSLCVYVENEDMQRRYIHAERQGEIERDTDSRKETHCDGERPHAETRTHTHKQTHTHIHTHTHSQTLLVQKREPVLLHMKSKQKPCVLHAAAAPPQPQIPNAKPYTVCGKSTDLLWERSRITIP